MKYISVTVDGMGRRYPVTHVKMIGDLPNGGALVVVNYPSFSIGGEITAETRAELLGFRLDTGEPVVIEKKDSALMRWLRGIEPVPPSDAFKERYAFLKNREDSETPV